MLENELIVVLENDDDDDDQDFDDACGSVNPSKMSSKTKRTRLTFPFGACRVCTDSATGIHYGIATCEGCKGFFKRSILRKEKYRCYFDSTCLVNVTNRNRCKACRFRRCTDEGMSVDGVKMGRIPKLVKERALKELKEQQVKKEAAAAAAAASSASSTNAAHARDSSCSSLSDRSIENYDPNPMETDYLEPQVSPVQRQGNVTNTYHYEKKAPSKPQNQISVRDPQPVHESGVTPDSQRSTNFQPIEPGSLPEDFTVDETHGMALDSTGFLTTESFVHVQTIAKKSSLRIDLNDDESKFVRFLRWSTHDIFQRHSKRANQMIARMHQMVDQNIQQFPGDKATSAEFFTNIRRSYEVYTRSTVVYIQELPGIKNMPLGDLQSMILHRSFDWFLIKYHALYHDNGQCYVLTPSGLQITRQWMHRLHGHELTETIFEFARVFRELELNDTELSLVLPVHLCFHDSTMESPEIPRMLRLCYFHTLYTELCHQRGEIQGKLVCNRICQALNLLISASDLYRRDAASRILEG